VKNAPYTVVRLVDHEKDAFGVRPCRAVGFDLLLPNARVHGAHSWLHERNVAQGLRLGRKHVQGSTASQICFCLRHGLDDEQMRRMSEAEMSSKSPHKLTSRFRNR